MKRIFQGEVFNFEAQGFDTAPITQWVEYVMKGVVPPSSKETFLTTVGQYLVCLNHSV